MKSLVSQMCKDQLNSSHVDITMNLWQRTKEETTSLCQDMLNKSDQSLLVA